MDYLEIRRNYVGTLNGLEKLALRDLAAWWDSTEGTPFIRRRELMQEPFTAISTAYGEQAAHAAADYLFLQRSLDKTLAGEAYPDVADPVGYDQAVASYRAASRVSKKDWKKFVQGGAVDGITEFNATTFDKLSGALNRLVLQPARTTISQNIAEGMKFARVPEPGACKWCLMLASRGAAYSADTAGMTAATRYHDNCRCVAVEVGRGAPLPAINRELEAAWKLATSRETTESGQRRVWDTYLNRRAKLLQSRVKFPPIPGVTTPKYRRGRKTISGTVEFDRRTKVTKEVPLPDLSQMPGHVLYGWSTAPPWGRKNPSTTRRAPGDYRRDNRFGHRHDSVRPGTKFDASWSDQKIVNSVRDVLDDPDEVEIFRPRASSGGDGGYRQPDYDYKVTATGTIDGTKIWVKYTVIDDVALECYAFPERR